MKLSETQLSTGGLFRCCLANFTSSFFPSVPETEETETQQVDPEVAVGHSLACSCGDRVVLNEDSVWRRA